MLSLKYRPKSMDQIFGNRALKAKIEAILQRPFEDMPKTVMFQGPPGCGKTTLSRIFASAIDGSFRELNIAHTRGVEAARQILGDITHGSLTAKRKVLILNEIQGATKDFLQTMLEALEEPPSHVMFILCTTDPGMLPAPIRDNQRAMTFSVNPLKKVDAEKLIKYVLEEEKVEEFPEAAIDRIITVSEGHPRKILTILDSVIDILDDELLIEAIDGNTGADDPNTKALCLALLKKDEKEVRKILRDIHDDPEQLRRAILGYMQVVLLNNPVNDKNSRQASDIIANMMNNFFYTGKPGLTWACIESVR